METNKTLAEVYKNASEEVKEILEAKFSDEELGIEYIPKVGDIVIYNDFIHFVGIIIGENYPAPNWYKIFDPLVPNNTYDKDRCYIDHLRLATEEEKQEFFNYMAAKGYKWNAEEKKVEKIKWEPNLDDWYYGIWSNGEVKCIQNITNNDMERIKIGNCFMTEEEAQKYADKFKEILKERNNI